MKNTCKQWYGEFMDDNIKFLNKVLTPTFQENYHIRTVEETTLGHRDGILVPVYTVYVRVLLDTYQEEEIKEISRVGYEAILDMKQAGFKSQYDEKKVVRICSLDKSFDKAYEELRTNRLSEKLLDMVVDIY